MVKAKNKNTAGDFETMRRNQSIRPLVSKGSIEGDPLINQIKDIDKIEEVVEDIDVLIFQIGELSEDVDEYGPEIEVLQRNLALANDQMKTIMSDHSYMGDMLKELGKSQPAGERRDYGGYSGY